MIKIPRSLATSFAFFYVALAIFPVISVAAVANGNLVMMQNPNEVIISSVYHPKNSAAVAAGVNDNAGTMQFVYEKKSDGNYYMTQAFEQKFNGTYTDETKGNGTFVDVTSQVKDIIQEQNTNPISAESGDLKRYLGDRDAQGEIAARMMGAKSTDQIALGNKTYRDAVTNPNDIFRGNMNALGELVPGAGGKNPDRPAITSTSIIPQQPIVRASNNPSTCGSFVATGDYCLLTGKLGTYFTDGKIHIRSGGLSMYLDTMYKIGVGVATGLALIFITIGGVQYASTDSITGTEHGKQTIQNALLGLLLVLGSYIMLNAINPNLLKNSLELKKVDPIGAVTGDTSNLQQGQTTMESTGMTSSGYSKGVSTDGVEFVDGPGGKVIGSGEATIDYDASPGAYRLQLAPDATGTLNKDYFIIDGQKYISVGYENAANALSNSGKWVGVQTNSNGSPIINSDGTMNGQVAYTTHLNGDTTSFAVVTSAQLSAIKAANPSFRPGQDYVILTNQNTGVSVKAVVADYGGSAGINHMEFGPATAQALGVPVVTRNGVVVGTSGSNPITMSLP